MEKTISIVIGSTTFTLTESAYELLRSYLATLTRHFSHDEDGSEIVRDIESRIAEKLLEHRRSIIEERDIRSVTTEIGTAGDMDIEESPVTPSKKLYRDQDRAIIAGVASGIAAYFGIDPLIVRIVFAASILFGGTGIVLYVVLWLLIPRAENASQKLEMRGTAVTLESISRIVKDRVEETRTPGLVRRLLYFPFEVLGAAIRFVTRVIYPILRTLIAIVLLVGTFFAIIAVTIGLGSILGNWNADNLQFPLKHAASPELLIAALCAAYLVILVPLILVHALGHKLVHSRTIIPSVVGFGLVGIWALSLIALGISGTKIAIQYQAHIATDPAYAEETMESTLEPFTSIEAKFGTISIEKGDAYSMTLEGRRKDLGRIQSSVIDGVLHIEPLRETEPCLIFCDTRTPSVTVTLPAIQSLQITGRSAELVNITEPTLTLTARHSRLYGSITVDSLTIDTLGSSIELTGTAGNATIATEHSSLDARDLEITNATTSTRGSSLNLWVIGALNSTPDFSSHIEVRK